MNKNLLFSVITGTFLFLNLSSNAIDPQIAPCQLYYLDKLTTNRVPESVFNELIEKNNVVAVFSAHWCGPCKALQPHIASVATEFNNVIFIKIDTDIFKALATRYNIRGIPTVICFKNKGIASQFSGGGMNKSMLKTKIASIFN